MIKDRPHCLIVGVGAGTGLACVRWFVDGSYEASMIARHEGHLATWTDEIFHTAPFLSDIMDIEKYCDTLVQISAEHGVPKVIVCYASLATFANFSELDPANFERNFCSNTTGLLMTAQAFGPDMVAAGSGAIVVTGNSGACRGTAWFVGFAPTKVSQRILGESLARELGPQGVQSRSSQRCAVSEAFARGYGLAYL
ncbi:MAG: SDR family NAD(P)-dependent oxidoreductase [Pseudomonadota bacterium]|nr:SDR family NAD(P)-dependent oxidoreductase [Pseudomonadota bacterium]